MSTTINITTDKGVIKCEAVWSQDGLAIHRGFNQTSGWTITHLASGYAVFKGIRDLDVARKTGEQLLLAGDWTQDTDDARADEDIRHTALVLRDKLFAQGAFDLDEPDEEVTE